MKELELLLRAVKREFGACPTWQPLIAAAERELQELLLKNSERVYREVQKTL